MSLLGQNLALFLVIHYWNQGEKFNSIARLSTFGDSISILVNIVFSLFIFSLFEKLFKEFWVIRETNEKSFTTFHSFYEENSKETIIVNSDLKSLMMNSKCTDTLQRLIKKSPTSLRDFIHEDSFETFREEVLKWIKEKKTSTCTVYLTKIKGSNLDPNSPKYKSPPLLAIGKLPYLLLYSPY